MVRAIEDVGFDSLWLGEHLLYRWRGAGRARPVGGLDDARRLAAATSRVEFGPLVACTGFHNPALLAKQAATVDEISGGRLILGLGAGWNETEFRAFGFPFDHRVDRFEEAFTIIRTLLREGAIDFDGRYYQARDCELLPRGPRPGGPPLLIGSNGPRMLRDHDAPRRRLEHLVRRHRQHAGGHRAAARRRRRGVPRRRSRPGGDRADRRGPGPAARRDGPAVGRRRRRPRSAPLDRRRRRPWPMRSARYAREGIGHVQLVVDPITRASIDALVPVLRALDGADPRYLRTGRNGGWCVLASPAPCEPSPPGGFARWPASPSWR